MAYSRFSLDELQTTFDLTISEGMKLFAEVPDLAPSPLLTEILQYNIPLAIAIGTEKARSELIVAPILVEIRKQLNSQISFFSGVDFNVDFEKGLNGVCDFLISLSPQQLFVKAPVVNLVEAKNDNLKSGLAQCIAEMVAAQLFNQKANNNLKKIYGGVTTGTSWQFITLEEQIVKIDLTEYSLENLPQILGILVSFVSSQSKS
ncbi:MULTISPECIES: hypothetical protein [unclassified Coleofasciculus]|uniref:hypothetical protein n=1 Tax=unclassified Coleofasciculus TaxID=2692782 RepID=UPI0018800D81|nr:MULTISPECIES: hypothetical protein [unclassified Coleofasciculus]MBE9127455.1 hypothetical protein [Coleofasciculus sp. LEGE 07081]MBE9150727.1 hypothetical protein [Coleofasciculus sp. LEGE 07092]